MRKADACLPGDEEGTQISFEEIYEFETKKLGTRAAQGFAAGAESQIADATSAGLALSGGGIRSAAFSLGVLQALDAANGLSRIEYLSTVSGGGYIGAALIAGLKRGNGMFPFKATTGGRLGAADIADSPAVRELRDRSRYLMPDGRFDLVVSVAILLRGLVVNIVQVACFVLIAAAATLALFPDEAGLARSPALEALRPISANGALMVRATFGDAMLATKLLLVFLLGWLAVWAIVRSIVIAFPNVSGRILCDPGSRSARTTGGFLVLIGAIAILEAQPLILASCAKLFETPNARVASTAGLQAFFAGLLAATGAIAVFWRVIVWTVETTERDPGASAILKRIGARALLVAAAGALPLLIYSTYLLVTVACLGRADAAPRAVALIMPAGPHRDLALVAPVLLLAAYLSILMAWGPMPDTVLNASWWRLEAFRNIRFFAGLLALLALAGVAVFIGLSGGLVSPPRQYDAALTCAAVAGLSSLAVALFTENANTLHRLYRDRLQDAFNLTGSDDALLVSGLNNLQGRALKPYLIVNATVNVRSPRYDRRGRKADFFVFTPDHVGSEATGYAPTAEYEKAEPRMDLATVVAVSGAAVASAMGRTGAALLSPTLALLNLRLGLWVRNPRYARTPEDRTRASRGDWNVGYAVREVLGLLDERSRKVYVTDGGHIDNLGLHQLLKRRCELIIVSDAEQDPNLTFGAFVDVERFARMDLGVRLDVPLDAIREQAMRRRELMRKDPTRSHKIPVTAHTAIGTVTYPATAGGLPAKEGTVLYLKASVTGDERSYVLDYERRHPRFPHEPTSDQFFSEEQFEAYRALGFHVASGALVNSDGTARWTHLLGRLRVRLGIWTR